MKCMKREGKKIAKGSREEVRRVIIKLLSEIFLGNQKLQPAVNQAVENIIEIFEHKDLKNPRANFCPSRLVEYREVHLKSEVNRSF